MSNEKKATEESYCLMVHWSTWTAGFKEANNIFTKRP